MNTIFTAGNKGRSGRGDCYVVLEPNACRGLEIDVQSSVQALYGKTIRSLAETVCRYFGMTSGKLWIEDQGALDFVIIARIEACVKQIIETQKNYLPEMLEQNMYASTRKRIRMSRLYLPGNSPKMIINGGIYKPHAIILDLEDSVAVSKKAEACLLVRNALRQVDFYGAERMVRINQLPRGLKDLEQIVPHNVHVVLVPKCESAETVQQVNDRIDQINQANGAEREIYLMPIIENSKGVLKAEEIASAAGNIVAMTIGLEDYTADLGVKRTFEGLESAYARSHLVNVCKAYGLQAIDSVFSDFGDLEALAVTVKRSKALGFEGMGCIHPKQIQTLHKGYAPDVGEIEKALKIVLAFKEATRNGIGVVSLGTKMIDPPVVERARQVLQQAVALQLLPANEEKKNA